MAADICDRTTDNCQDPIRVLFVDDDPTLLEVQKLLLERLGFFVTICMGGCDAWQTFSASPHSFDIVLTDLTMPDIPGHELARLIKTLRPDIPVVACSGYDDDITNGNIDNGLITQFLAKPITARAMKDAICRAVMR